jgi:hypothetical protein
VAIIDLHPSCQQQREIIALLNKPAQGNGGGRCAIGRPMVRAFRVESGRTLLALKAYADKLP